MIYGDRKLLNIVSDGFKLKKDSLGRDKVVEKDEEVENASEVLGSNFVLVSCVRLPDTTTFTQPKGHRALCKTTSDL